MVYTDIALSAVNIGMLELLQNTQDSLFIQFYVSFALVPSRPLQKRKGA